jgi:hypothetical protein
MKLLRINQYLFSIDGLQQTIRDAKGEAAPIECTVDNTGVVSSLALSYHGGHGGEQYPVTERIPGRDDRLLEIAKPKYSRGKNLCGSPDS